MENSSDVEEIPGHIWNLNGFTIHIYAQHLETIEDSSRIINDYVFYANDGTNLAIWSNPYKFTMSSSDASHNNGNEIKITAEISSDKKTLLNLVCKYWRRNGISITSNAINADFELSNIPVLSEGTYGSYKTIQFKITGEDVKNHLKINQYNITDFIPYKLKQVSWQYISTVWDSNSYILVEF